MLARAVDEFPTGEHWRYEPKWDGFRCIASRDLRTSLSAKSGARLDGHFPELHEAVRLAAPPDTTIDGEIVRWSGEKLDFDALLRRNSASTGRAKHLAEEEPCHLIVFDLLREKGADLTRRPLSYRRERLEEMFAWIVEPLLMLGWQTSSADEAMQWYEEMAGIGVEGLVVKDERRVYRAGRRDWLKFKRRVTTEAIVGGAVPRPDEPRMLVLGRYDDAGELRVAGQTVELTPAQRDEIAPLLQRAGDDHPWPATLAPARGGRERLEYRRVEPTVVVEIQPDTSTTGVRWRNPVRLTRARPDLRPAEVPRGLDLET
ncbi:ATP-dependent DNA ligase [Nocardiopsis sediminis]|uniref:ATP-dependent DNA ligase n=1 Tax=Nocardiopsis sediminis TaxID=1778267 RepID=A0ABV8FQ63_9ACTN